MIAILIGPPGSGKGTQAQSLRDSLGALHLSTGEMLRSEISAGSDIGAKAKSFMTAGQLVPDEVVVEVVASQINKSNADAVVLLDGFPRNTNQAETLDAMLAQRDQKVNKVVEIQIDDSILMDRLTGRFACAKCGEGYHKLFKRPAQDDVCDKCGSSEFDVRPDDQVDTIRDRLKVHHDQTAPLLPYYAKQGLLVQIDGDRNMDVVTKELEIILSDGQ
ncbi:MAG: adenylate kinase [Alphaproteobacteria bacterium]|jgi:adenylate kinase